MENANAAGSVVESGIITKWIERYYEEKLDKREKQKNGPGAAKAGARKTYIELLMEQMLYLN